MTADPRAVEIIADALKDHALLRFKGLRYVEPTLTNLHRWATALGYDLTIHKGGTQ